MTNQGTTVPEEDFRIALAELKGMLSATLPQHAARLDEHDRAITNIAAIVTQQGQDIAAVKAVAETRAADLRDAEAVKRTVPVGWQVAGVLIAAAAVVVTVLLYALNN